jgi:SH3 domain protein
MSCFKYLLLILVLWGTLAAAENRWVTDEFEVMMRSGKSTKQSIIRQLRSGTQVELIQTDADSGYSQVRAGSGAEGWVLSRYLRGAPTARLQLPDLEKRLAASEAQRAKVSSELAALRQSRRGLEREVGELQSANSAQQNQLTRITKLSSDTIQVDQQNRQLKQRLGESEQQIAVLEAENIRLSSRVSREWFLIGGAVLVAGLLLGLIIPRISWRKKSSWNDF